MPNRFALGCSVAVLFVVCTGSRLSFAGETPPAAVDFARDVYPIFERSCFECHGPQRQEGELRLDQRDAAFAGGSSGAAISPGKLDESELLRRVSLPEGHDEIMPARGKPLSRGQVETLRAWIAAGAVWPDNFERAAHWAYVPPVRPALPQVVETGWPRGAIDRFVLARLQREHLPPSPEADRPALIRRLSLDLVGLPPSPREVDAFVADRSDDAYEKLVDRLLASPQFGERWARPWLDLARYADSHGFQRDDLRELWPYRDWVIRALNDDLPFDRFSIEQLAGDLLPEAGESQRIATGFHRATTTNVEAGSDPEETRINQVIDRLNTTAAVWLGTTLECAQCHDHKYDPFTQRDYYGLLAFFNNTEIEADRSNPNVPGSIRFLGPSMDLHDEKVEAERRRLQVEIGQIDQQTAARRSELSGDLPAWEATLSDEPSRAPATHVLKIAAFNSAEGAEHKLLDDGSVLLVGDPPAVDTYTVTVETTLRDISGLKLETLADPSLPGEGPGRGDPQRPNFVLNTFSVTAAPLDGSRPPQPLELTAREASFEQQNYPLAGALDKAPNTAWAIGPKFHESHWAAFGLKSPLGDEGGTRLTFTLVQQFGAARTIGRLRLSALTGDPAVPSLPAEVVEILKTAPDARTDAQRSKLLDVRLERDPAAQKFRTRRQQLEKSLAALKKPTTLVMRELPEPRAMHIFTRGDFRTPGDPVAAGVPQVLHPLLAGPPNRLTLARWLVDRRNPLTARVVVNRYWAELFGRGLVTTVEDFGVKGEPPTHPELLDWLAVEFMEGGWSMKRLLREIVTSAAYRQSSRATPELLARDDRNLLSARGPRFRLSAEAIRDNALSIAGLLCLTPGGPPIRPYQPDGLWTKVGGAPLTYDVSPGAERHRRGIYVVWKRASPYPSFVNFDATARLACTFKRSRSNTPLQALTLLNDPVYVEAAFALAERVLRERVDAPLDEQIRYAFRLCLARSPDDAELGVLRQLHSAQLAAARSDPAAAKTLGGEAGRGGVERLDELVAWYAVASALLNLDETITKN
ncbi:MAG TPA: PSD1 and planctomycete cytochrome C domain-containing protein [Pirellulales bacterium]|nr:PSD1 and planctomycete cytochrome C domain-containing protein [Pirellulales bacterium]